MSRIVKLGAVLFILISWWASADEEPSVVQALTPEVGFSHGLGLANGESVSYRFQLQGGEFLALTIQQQGVDVVLDLFAEGHQIARVDSPNGDRGRERLVVAVEVETEFRLDVLSGFSSSALGRYHLEVLEKRPLTPRDLLEVEAQGVLFEGWQHMKSLQSVSRRIVEGQGQVLAEYERAIALAHQAKAAHLEATVWFQYARLLIQMGKLQRASEALRRGRQLWKFLGDAIAQGFTLRMEGNIYLRTGDDARLLEIRQEEIRHWERLDVLDQQAALHMLIGKRFIQVGEMHRAFSSFSRAVELARKSGSSFELSRALEQLAFTYEAFGELEKALDYFREAQVAAAVLPDLLSQGKRFFLIGRLNASRGETDQALQAFEQAFGLWEKADFLTGKASALLNLGRIWQERGNFERASESYRRAIQLWREERKVAEEIHGILALGAVRVAEGNLLEARTAFDNALRLAEAIHAKEQAADALLAMAQLERQNGNLERALALSTRALERVESERAEVRLDDLRAAYLATRREDYAFQIDLLMELDRESPSKGYDVKALEYSERAKARSLLELLTESGIDLEVDLDPTLAQRQTELEERLAQTQRQLIEALQQSPPHLDEVRGREFDLKQIEEEQRAFEREIRNRQPRYANLRYPEPLGLQGMRQQLDSSTALLGYFLGNDASFLFVLTDRQFRTFRLPSAGEIAGQVEALRESLHRPGRRNLNQYLQAARALHAVLLEPAQPILQEKQHLVISPDGALHSLPFEALITSKENPPRPDLASLEFLLRRWSVSYVPSASVLAELASPQSSSNTFLAFADPEYPRPQDSAAMESSAQELLVRSVFGSDSDFQFKPLPETRREVSVIAESRRPAASFLYLAEQAKEENVKQNVGLKTARYLHFATHGLVSELQPRYSGLVLSLDPSSKEDGLLQVHEIFKLRLAAELVVLSACETGLGKEVLGEGFLGLTRAFFYAGAPSLVVSLWQVADESTAELMIDFYRHLEKTSKGGALRQAKLALIEGGRFAHPYYWAPFVLQGRWE